MRSHTHQTGRWAVTLALATFAVGMAQGQSKSPALDRLGWLAGCWEQSQGRRVVHEQWMGPLGGSMLGMSRTTAGDRTLAYEFLRIEVRDGQLVYIAAPSGQPETAFPAVEQRDDVIVFANPSHDFPQRIRYRRLADGSLVAQIEGDEVGRTRVVEFPMRRIRCGGEGAARAR